MQTFEFNTKITDGIIKIPEIRTLRPDQEVKVILLINDLGESDSQEKLLSEYTEKQDDRSELSDKNKKKQDAIHLLQSWMSDESGYDESVWDDLKKNIEKNRLSERKRFND